MTDAPAGRPNQKQRTRKDLLQAAARLLKQGRQPSLEEIAEEALVSRATVYRHFPNLEALLIEAPLDVAVPDGEQLFGNFTSVDPVARVQRVDAALEEVILANEASLRMMLVFSLQRSLRNENDGLSRQNRRTSLIQAALAPSRQLFTPGSLETLTKALALIVGTEARVVFKDVLQLDDAEARRVKRWAIKSLVEAAKR
ncbi:MAG: helix-turn-helix domain-containing protein [Arenimonas sp.]|jgi:AcrR family transcriptional regulator